MAQTKKEKRLGAAKRRMRDWRRYCTFKEEHTRHDMNTIQAELHGIHKNLGGNNYATQDLDKVARELGLGYWGPMGGLYVLPPSAGEEGRK